MMNVATKIREIGKSNLTAIVAVALLISGLIYKSIIIWNDYSYFNIAFTATCISILLFLNKYREIPVRMLSIFVAIFSVICVHQINFENWNIITYAIKTYFDTDSLDTFMAVAVFWCLGFDFYIYNQLQDLPSGTEECPQLPNHIRDGWFVEGSTDLERDIGSLKIELKSVIAMKNMIPFHLIMSWSLFSRDDRFLENIDRLSIPLGLIVFSFWQIKILFSEIDSRRLIVTSEKYRRNVILTSRYRRFF